MKKYIIALLSLACLQTVSATDLPDFPFVYSEGRATTNVPPNKVVIELTIKCFDSSSSNAVDTVEKTSRQLVHTLQDSHGIDISKITAKNLSKNAVQKREEYQLLEILGYDVSRQISLEIHKIESFSEIMKMISSTDFTTSIKAEFGHKSKDKILTKLSTQACTEAYRKAELLANSSGGELGDLFAISSEGLGDISVKFRPYFHTEVGEINFFGSRGQDPSITFFAPDTITFNAGVTTIYKLK